MGTTPTVLKIVDITTNGNVRRDLRLDDGFIASIKKKIVQPLIVREENGVYILVAGHRRLAAAVEGGLIDVPVRIIGLDESEVTETQTIENLHRNDLTPLETAQATWELKVDSGYTQDMVAEALSMPKGVVSELQKIGKAVASDEYMDDERLDQMNQLTLEGLVDLIGETPDEVHVSDVIRIYDEDDGNNQSIRGAIRSAKHEAELAVFYEEIAKDMHAWNEAGIQTVAGDPTIIKGEKDQWGNDKHSRKFEMIGRNGVDVDLDEHMKLPCHIIQIDDGGDRYGYSNKPRVVHWCSDGNIHSHKGKSSVKVVTAEEDFDRKSKTLADSRAIRSDKAERRTQAMMYMATREAKARTLEIALEVANDTMHWDDKKLACQILEIDTDRPVPTDSSWYANRWNKHLEELFGKSYLTDDKCSLYRLRMLIAIKHWQDRAWASQPVVKAAVAEIGAIEVPTAE